MELVTYSDSEASDAESPKRTVTSRDTPSNPTSKLASFQPLVDRSNPRKIVVNLSTQNKTSEEAGDIGAEEGPARKRPRIAGGGSFAGFNSMLPAPKRKAQDKSAAKSPSQNTRKVFSLKTSATPGFVRESGTEASDDNIGVDNQDLCLPEPLPSRNDHEVVEKKGNPMMFKPLSVARNMKKKPKPSSHPSISQETSQSSPHPLASPSSHTKDIIDKQEPKKKLSLFGLSNTESTPLKAVPPLTKSTYEPLIHMPSSELPLESQPVPPEELAERTNTVTTNSQSNSLENIAKDLNLSRSEMRQLMGRKGNASAVDARILTFNTDKEYESNSAFLASMSEQELAAQNNNPVRSIAPGKHNLQQLVNAVSNQRDALEESFASGKRNRQEAGNRYGW